MVEGAEGEVSAVIHKAGFRSLGKGELVEFEPRQSSKGIEATFVCGIGGVKCRGSDRRPIPKEKFQSKPVQLQQRQPQRRQSQGELQLDRFHGRSGRSTCNITSQPVDDSAVYTVRPLVDGPALTLNSDKRDSEDSNNEKLEAANLGKATIASNDDDDNVRPWTGHSDELADFKENFILAAMSVTQSRCVCHLYQEDIRCTPEEHGA
ncbi:hypothetical protein C0Q70_17280 [Pomacea canaliculata]|uniref:Uncharacterized protein n=1 Tax=Pomacea canaliculata TaxID=400727 RepID=A0A2T7NS86_POMCA|nr:hypothetical protein C0Q70_17280 [Pomacea canaliculata]